jgi:hypothetical protein
MAKHNHGISALKQGQSTFTIDKQYGLDRVLAQWFSIAEKVTSKHHQWAGRDIHYIDMNAGSGFNHETDEYGSPLIAMDLAFEKFEWYGSEIHFNGWFLEKNKLSYDELCERVYEMGVTHCDGPVNIHPICLYGDSSKLLFDIIKPTLLQKQFGLIYFDPNGIKMNSTESVFDVAKRICDIPTFRFTDVLIRLSGTNYKRVRSVHSKYPPLVDQLSKINKKQWICRQIHINERGQRDPNQWTFLFGTNWTDYRAWESEGFYKIEDPRSDFHIINNTKSEMI